MLRSVLRGLPVRLSERPIPPDLLRATSPSRDRTDVNRGGASAPASAAVVAPPLVELVYREHLSAAVDRILRGGLPAPYRLVRGPTAIAVGGSVFCDGDRAAAGRRALPAAVAPLPPPCPAPTGGTLAAVAPGALPPIRPCRVASGSTPSRPPSSGADLLYWV